MNKDQIELLIDTVGNEVIESLKDVEVFDITKPDTIKDFLNSAKIDENLN